MNSAQRIARFTDCKLHSGLLHHVHCLGAAGFEILSFVLAFGGIFS